MDGDKSWDLEDSIDSDSSSSLQSWSFSLPFSGLSVPQFPGNPIPNLAQNLQGIRGYFPSNLTLPIFASGVTSIPMPSMIPSFISKAEGENASWSIPSITMPSMPSMPSIPSIPSMVSSAFNSVSFQETPRKSWSELQDSVRRTQRKLREIAGKVPSEFNFAPLLDEHGHRIGTRIYVCFAVSGSNMTLHYCDIKESGSQSKPSKKASKKKEISASRESTPPRQSSPKPSSIYQDSLENDSFQPFRSSPTFPIDASSDEFSNKRVKPATDFEWRPLIDPNARINSPKGRDSLNRNEEKLQLDRKGVMFPGITQYQFHQKSRRFVFSCYGNLYYFDDVGDPPYMPIRSKSSTKSAKSNPTICPSNSDLIAYHIDGDLWVTSLKTGQKLRLTKTKTPESHHVLSAGHSSFVIQEEFNRHTGFWWRPGSKRISENVREYDILYEQVDETQVEVVHLLNNNGGIDKYRYPRAGGTNALSVLKLASFKYDKSSELLSDAYSQAIRPLQSLYSIYPNFEYLVRCDWYSRDCVWVQLLNRQQRHLVLGLFSLSNIFPPQVLLREDNSPFWINVHDVLHFINTKKRLRRGSTSAARFNRNTDRRVDDLKPGSLVKFIWISQNSGHRHLCLVKVQLVGREDETAKSQPAQPNIGSSTNRRLRGGPNNRDLSYPSETTSSSQQYQQDDQDPTSSSPSGVSSQYEALLIEKTFLTSGEWEVDEKGVWVDENSYLVYFIATKDTPLEQHLYCVSYRDEKQDQNCDNSSRKIVKLTNSGFSHSTIAFNDNCDLFINIQSSVSYAPFGYVNKRVDTSYYESNLSKRSNKCSPGDTSGTNSNGEVKFTKLGLIVNNCVQQAAMNLTMGSSSPSKVQIEIDAIPGIIKPELFQYQLKSGDTVYGLIFKPEFIDQGVKYPCVLDIYGGPEVQTVTNSFKCVRHPRFHLLANEGYVVVAIDSRGSHNRGMKFESHIHLRVGQVEIKDQVEVLTWLAEAVDYIDMTRIAIHGWSYGGYLALMGLAQRPDIFRVAIAGAPVTNWELYDTGYTERYLDSPYNNPAGYAKGNVLNYVHTFPDEENRLLLVHGLMDENVHFIHTQQLIQALIKHGKPYNLQVFPSECHSLRNSSLEFNKTLLISFLEQHLKPYRSP